MKVVKIATVAAMALNLVGAPINVLANQNGQTTVTTVASSKQVSNASVSKFNPYGGILQDAYNAVFKIDNSTIKSITNNGGNYSGSPLSNAIDGDMKTHWETGRANTTTFKNEVVFNFNETTSLNRIVYAARQSSGKGKGFAQKFDVYSSTTDEGDNFELVSSGNYKGSTGDIIEIQIKPTKFKRLKFVYKEANQDWASASEFLFYKEDRVTEKMGKLFTDDTFSTVNKEFASIATLKQLESEVKEHPLYPLFKEDITNAMALVENKEVHYLETVVSKFENINSPLLPKYDEAYKLTSNNITKITANGGNYASNIIERAIDGNVATQWHSGVKNSDTFTNEVVMELDELRTLNRIVFTAPKGTNRGFPEAFEIYASRTSKGDTFERVSSGTAKTTQDSLEFKFNPTEFKRVKFVFKKGYENWACASEFGLYTVDQLSEKMTRLFTDETMSKVSDQFNTQEKISALEEEAKKHPFYEKYKVNLANAKALISEETIEPTVATTKPFEHYSKEGYSELFKMDTENIQGIKNNGRHYGSAVIKNAVDDNLDTYWETGTANTNTFKNEVEVEFKKAITLNRVMYGARKSDRKGFAEEFEIYASQTSVGDTYQLVSTGKHNTVAGLVEAKFNPTTFKRVKFVFKKSNQNWASLSELAFYKEDTLFDQVNALFTDGTMSAVIPAFNNIEKLNALEKEAQTHPLYTSLKDKIDLAKKIVKGEVTSENNIFTIEQRGDGVTHARTTLQTSSYGTNLLPTGIAALAGEQIKVYVDVEDGKPLPQIAFAQQRGNWNQWIRKQQLHQGENIFTVPTIHSDKWVDKVIPGGAIYIENPYTNEQQGKAPRVRIVGGHDYPLFNDGDDVVAFKQELLAYKEKLANEPTKYVDIVEIINDYALINSNMASADQAYLTGDRTPQTALDFHKEGIGKMFAYAGIGEKGDIKHIRNGARANMRLMQPFAAAYAWGDHTGFQQGAATELFQGGSYGWAVTHELGHHFDIKGALVGEVTNNMWANYMQVDEQNGEDRIAQYYEKIFDVLSPEDKVNTGNYAITHYMGVWWQLHLLDKDYWPKYQTAFRNDVAKDMGLTNQERMAVVSSYAIGMDVTEHFDRHEFIDSASVEKVKQAVKKMGIKQAPENIKPWYLWTKATKDRESSFGDNKYKPEVISYKKNGSKITMQLGIDDAAKEALLGYEISRDGKVIGFTRTSTFTTADLNDGNAHEYKVRAFDLRLNTTDYTEINSFKPFISLEDQLTLKLHQEFNPLDYVKAFSHQGEDISKDIVVKSNNVDVSKKGNYEIVYEVKNAGATDTKTLKVTVVSNYTYISDMDATLANIAWGGLKKDLAPAGSAITLLRKGTNVTYPKGIGTHANSEVVYNIEGKGFNFFESYIGIDQSMKGAVSSATFEVWVDGEKKFASNVFKADTDQAFIKVPVAGAKEVKLITTDAKQGGNQADHTVWADAKFTQDSSKPTLTIPSSTATKVGEAIDLNGGYFANDAEDGDLTNKVVISGMELVNFNKVGKYELTYSVTDSDGNEVTQKRTISVVNMDDFNYLSDFNWTSTQNSYTAPKKDISVGGKTLRLTADNGNEVAYKKGIGAHSNSTIIYDLTDKDAEYFTSFVGIDRHMYGSVGSVTFQVFVDGEMKFDSKLMNSKDPQKFVEVNLGGAKELKLVVTDGGNGNGSDHATWGDAKLHFSNENSIFTTDLEAAIEKAKSINAEDFTAESIAALQSSIERAQEVLANTVVTQVEIDQAVEMLQQAIDALVAIDMTQVVTIPDASLRSFIKQQLGITGDVTLSDMYKLTTLSAEATRTEQVLSLEGLQYAKNLVSLTITGNAVTDFSPLQGLEQLKDLLADPQVLEMPSPTGQEAIFTLDNPVIGLDGKHVNPTQIALRNTQTFKELPISVDQFEVNSKQLTLDLTNADKGSYMLIMTYEVEGNMIQIQSIIENK